MINLLIFIFGISFAVFVFVLHSRFSETLSNYSKYYFKTTQKELTWEDLIIPPATMRLYSSACALLAFLMIFFAGSIPFLLRFFIGLILAAVFSYVPKIFVKIIIEKRRKLFNSQVVDCLGSISRGLKAGLSLVQALERTSNYMPAPMSDELAIVMHEYELGVTIDQALKNMSERVKDDDMNLAVSAIVTTRSIGANLSEIFTEIIDTIRERGLIERKVKALTSQGKMQGIIVALVPVFFAIVVNMFNPQLMSLLYTTLLGWICIFVMVVLDVVGYFLIKNIVTVEV